MYTPSLFLSKYVCISGCVIPPSGCIPYHLISLHITCHYLYRNTLRMLWNLYPQLDYIYPLWLLFLSDHFTGYFDLYTWIRHNNTINGTKQAIFIRIAVDFQEISERNSVLVNDVSMWRVLSPMVKAVTYGKSRREMCSGSIAETV